jgi:ribosomal protein S18 acetylase RimI-like enzyme
LSALLERLLANVHQVAARTRSPVRIGPFTAYFDEVRTLKFFSFALPNTGVDSAAAAAALPALREAFAVRGRVARVEYFAELAPELDAVLEADGWSRSERMPVMTCTPDGHLSPPTPEGMTIERVGPGSTDALIAEYYEAQQLGFEDHEEITDALIERFRRAESYAVAGRLGGRLAGVANGTPIELGVVEVGGVATLPALRGRGIAGALTAASVSAAFAAGAELAWLTAADERAERIYARAGFSVAGTQLAHDAPA